MTIYTFYRIIYQGNTIYVGSTENFQNRKSSHMSDCFNEKRKEYNKLLYQFIRNNNIGFDELNFETLAEINTNIHLKLEQMFINQYDTIKNGLNEQMAYNPDFDNKEWKRNWYIENKERLNEKKKNITLQIRKK